MNRERLLQLIDACRPGSDDHLHGELAELGEEIARDDAARELFEQVQSQDAKLVELFQANEQDIEIPAGLQQRLEAALAASATHAPEQPQLTRLAAAVDSALEPVHAPQSRPVESATVETLPAPTRTKGPSRRRFVGVVLGSLATIAAIATLAVVLQPEKVQVLTLQQVADQASQWESSLNADDWETNVAWRTQTTPVPPELRRQPFRWQNWQDPWQGEGVVYDLSPSTAPESVFLYASVAVDNVTGLPPVPPVKAQSSTGNLSVAVWHRNEILYVLVIHGPQDRYRQLMDRTKIVINDSFSDPLAYHAWLAQR